MTILQIWIGKFLFISEYGDIMTESSPYFTTPFELMWRFYAESPVATAIISSAGEIKAINEAMESLFGLSGASKKNVIDYFASLFPEEDRDKAVQGMHTALKGGNYGMWYDYSFIHPDGSRRFVESAIFDISTESAPGIYLIHSIDKTVQRSMEDALKASERKFRSLVETAPDGIMMCDAEGTIVELNTAYAHIYGYNREEMLERSYLDFIPDFESRLQAEQMFLFLSRNRIVIPQEITITTKQGDTIPVEISTAVLKDESGAITNFIAIIRDISERIKSENALNQSEQRYRDLIESISDVAFAADSNGIITYISPSVEHVTGHDPSSIIGKKYDDFVHSGDREIMHNVYDSLKQGNFNKFECRIVAKNGDSIWMIFSIRPIFENERYIGIHGLATDITERKLAEDDLRKTREELETKSRHLEDANTALRVLLQHQEEEKHQQEDTIYYGITNLITPYMEKIYNSINDDQVKKYLDIISANLSKITKPYTNKLAEQFAHLTPTEIQIANLIRENRSTREISDILCVSDTTVFFHRRNLRDKLGLKNNHINLRSYLQSLDAHSSGD